MTDTLEPVESPSYPSERRRHSRREVRSIAYVKLDEGNGGIVLNVSEGGLSVQAVVSLMDDQLPRMRVQLPSPQDWIETGARIVWAGKSRKVVGLQFVALPEGARNQIRDWVSRETLPAPFPSDSHAPFDQEEPPAILPVTGQTTEAGFAEPVAPGLAGKHQERDVPPPMDRDIDRVLDYSCYQELKLTGRPPKAVPRAQEQVANYGALAALLAALALMSLVTGWEAGRGAFDGFLSKVHAMTSRNSVAEASVVVPVTPPSPAVSETQAEDTKDFNSAAPLSAPTPAPTQNPRRKASANAGDQASRRPLTLEARNLPPTIRRQAAGYSTGAEEGAPFVRDWASNSVNVLSAASTDFRSSMPPPPAARQPAVLQAAELVRRVDPVYPTFAKEQKIQGAVNLRIKIAADGTVHDIEVVSGSPVLARAAVNAVRQWRYRPTVLNGKPIQVDSEVSVVFHLP